MRTTTGNCRAFSLTSTGIGGCKGCKGRKGSLPGVAPELATIDLSIAEIKDGAEECSGVLDESATDSGQFFRKTFKKSLKILITLQNNLQDEPYSADTSGIYCTGEEGRRGSRPKTLTDRQKNLYS
jgi:hypothetical protein